MGFAIALPILRAVFFGANMKHKLKTLPEHFNDVLAGFKKAELRKNDRNFKVGDDLILLEFENKKFTGRNVKKVISHILYGGKYGLDKDYVILSMIN